MCAVAAGSRKRSIRYGDKSGKPVTNTIPCGFKKDPDEKHHWLVDEEAADVVRRIFHLSAEGKGPQTIAKILMMDKVERPSYKDKQMVKRPPEEWLIFENTHEAIVDAETWELAQRSRQTVRRTDATGGANPLTGLLFCAECGARMHNHRCGGRALREGWKPDADSGLYPSDNYNCSTYMLTAKHSEQKCCSHYITTRVVRALLLDTIKTVSTYAIADEKGFVEKIRAASQVRQDNAARELKRKRNRGRKRSAELDGLIKKPYESFATGKFDGETVQVAVGRI